MMDKLPEATFFEHIIKKCHLPTLIIFVKLHLFEGAFHLHVFTSLS